MRLDRILFSQGWGTRRECEALIRHGWVGVAGAPVDDPGAEFATEGLVYSVRGQRWPFHEKALVMLHKPAGYECSRKPRHHPDVLALLPPPLRTRGVQPVGRLDADTTGLLLLTDDGALIHRWTSPKRGRWNRIAAKAGRASRMRTSTRKASGRALRRGCVSGS